MNERLRTKLIKICMRTAPAVSLFLTSSCGQNGPTTPNLADVLKADCDKGISQPVEGVLLNPDEAVSVGRQIIGIQTPGVWKIYGNNSVEYPEDQDILVKGNYYGSDDWKYRVDSHKVNTYQTYIEATVDCHNPSNPPEFPDGKG